MNAPHYSPYSTNESPTLKGVLKFELTSFVGRLLLNRSPPKMQGQQLLNLGCGTNLYPEFVNTDVYDLRGSRGRTNYWMADLRYPLNCPDNYWDGVFTEHTLEHLHPERGLALLKELHRTMKVGAWLRIVVPDLRKYVDYYEGRPVDPMFSRWEPKAAAIRSLTQNYLHVACWDSDLMTDCLTKAGFNRIDQRSFKAGANDVLIKDTPSRAWESLYIEAQKS